MCTEENGIEVGRCLNDCDIEDTLCQSECVDDYYQDRNRCPCEVKHDQILELFKKSTDMSILSLVTDNTKFLVWLSYWMSMR